jgi:hypothetical protein
LAIKPSRRDIYPRRLRTRFIAESAAVVGRLQREAWDHEAHLRALGRNEGADVVMAAPADLPTVFQQLKEMQPTHFTSTPASDHRSPADSMPPLRVLCGF